MILKMVRGGYVYILTNANNTVLYTGVTRDINERIYDHRKGKFKGSFTSRYRIYKLVYYEGYRYIQDAIDREKTIKGGSRKKKLDLINGFNPDWVDLYPLEDY